jgi:hypothetical protein
VRGLSVEICPHATRQPFSPVKPVHANLLPPEPVEIWRREIRALRAATEMRDAGQNREPVARRINERLARTPFHLVASPDGGAGITIAYRPTLFIDALWQQFAREAAGINRLNGALLSSGNSTHWRPTDRLWRFSCPQLGE